MVSRDKMGHVESKSCVLHHALCTSHDTINFDPIWAAEDSLSVKFRVLYGFLVTSEDSGTGQASSKYKKENTYHIAGGFFLMVGCIPLSKAHSCTF